MTLLLTLFCSVAWSQQTSAADAFVAWIEKMEAAVDNLDDATFLFVRRERIKGKLTKEEQIYTKYRKPHDIYMRWDGGQYIGRELLYRKNWNNGKLKVKPSKFIPSLSLDPDGTLATRGQRHPVYNMGFVYNVGLIIEDQRRIRQKGHPVDINLAGNKDVLGTNSPCFEVHLPKAVDPEFYAYRVLICVDPISNLPNRFQSWDIEDGTMVMVEDYQFGHIEVNQGLSDEDFDPKNNDYRF